MLETVRISKQYPGTLALDEVSLKFEAGKVCALLGKNGAGKSTLVKILAGTVQPTSGHLLINGRPTKLHSARDAFHQGIATVYQELSLIPGLTVAENVLLGRMPHLPHTAALMIDWPAARTAAQAILTEMGISLDVRRRVSELGVAQQQLIEIAKAMSFRPRALMLDEPTSALARHETELLFRVIHRLASGGVAIIYITHRLQELAQIADTITVLRDGKHVGTVNRADTSSEEIVRMIFGEAVPHRSPPAGAQGKPLLEVRRLSRRDKFHDVSFTLHQGEILGIAGMLGSGRTELLRAIFGADAYDSGEVLLNGRAATTQTVRAMKRLGVAMVPENRKEQSLILPHSIRRNMALASMNRIGWRGLITQQREQAVTERFIERLAIKAPDARAPIASLSGGNQQKIVVGKWLNTMPKVILFDEPTRGIDLQAKQYIFQVMSDLSRQGLGSIVVSSELDELLEVCHRILIMKAGRIVDEVRADQVSVEELVLRCMEQSSSDVPSKAHTGRSV